MLQRVLVGLYHLVNDQFLGTKSQLRAPISDFR